MSEALEKADLIVLPGDIAEVEQAAGGELVERPVAVSLEFSYAAAQIAAAGDRSGFGEVELGVVGGLEMGMAEVGDLAAGGEMRMAGIPLKRGKDGGVGSETEFRGSHPGKGAAIEEFGIDQAELELAVIPAPEEGIVHLKGSVASSEVKWDGLVVPEDLAVAKFEMIDGKSEELLDGGLAFDGVDSSRREIGGAIGIESYVDHGLVEDDFVESKFGTEKRADLQASDDTVHVGKGNIGGGLTAVDGDIAYVEA